MLSCLVTSTNRQALAEAGVGEGLVVLCGDNKGDEKPSKEKETVGHTVGIVPPPPSPHLQLAFSVSLCP